MDDAVDERVAQETEAELDGFRVLVVDADADVRSRIRTVFLESNADVTVVEGSSATAALETLESTAVDCIVSEDTLPDRSGVDLLRTVRGRWLDLPFVLFTDGGSEALASEALGAGATDYLPKAPLPEQTAELVTRVVDAVSTRTERRGFSTG
ncbi:response regulator [Halomicroarcula sp. GCM10025710]